MTILVKKVFISSKPTFVCLLCPPLCGPFSIQESAAGGLSYKVKNRRHPMDAPCFYSRKAIRQADVPSTLQVCTDLSAFRFFFLVQAVTIIRRKYPLTLFEGPPEGMAAVVAAVPGSIFNRITSLQCLTRLVQPQGLQQNRKGASELFLYDPVQIGLRIIKM